MVKLNLIGFGTTTFHKHALHKHIVQDVFYILHLRTKHNYKCNVMTIPLSLEQNDYRNATRQHWAV